MKKWLLLLAFLLAAIVILSPWSEASLLTDRAKEELGTTEVPLGSNDGARVNEYQSVSGAYNQAWCASFVSWVIREVYPGHPLPPNPAYVPSYYQTIMSNSRGFHHVSLNQAQAGDVLVLYNQGHVAFFYRWVGPGVFLVIGGNQSDRVSIATNYSWQVRAVGRVEAVNYDPSSGASGAGAGGAIHDSTTVPRAKYLQIATFLRRFQALQGTIWYEHSGIGPFLESAILQGLSYDGTNSSPRTIWFVPGD